MPVSTTGAELWRFAHPGEDMYNAMKKGMDWAQARKHVDYNRFLQVFFAIGMFFGVVLWNPYDAMSF